MAEPELLNNVQHEGLTVDTRARKEYGDFVNRALVFSTEFGEAHKEFPILFIRNHERDSYEAHAILGFDVDENLFVDEGRWTSNYIPAVLARGPFLIGFQKTDHDGTSGKEPIVLVDAENPRVTAGDGKPVFLPHGGDTAYLDGVKRALQRIHQGAILDKTMVTCLTELDLFEPVSIEITLSNIHKLTFRNYLTINEKKLAQLDASSLQKLNEKGVLQLAFFALSSIGNFRTLIDRKNKQDAMVKQVV